MPAWKLFRAEVEKKLQANEDTINRLVFRTRTEIDPLEIEYFRGFRQGVTFALEGLPNKILSEYKLAKTEGE
jgi:hypothetical protein